MFHYRFLITFILLITLSACGSDSMPENISAPQSQPVTNPEICVAHDKNQGVNWQALLTAYCNNLSDYNLFSTLSDAVKLINHPGLHYELNSALFTDRTRKYRYLFIPENQSAFYSEQTSFYFPVGTVLVKIFSLPRDTTLDAEEIIEVRLLIHKEKGWSALPYQWDSSIQDAYFNVAGDSIPSQITHNGTADSFDYMVPTFGQCATCHQNTDGQATLLPIGLKARHLNKAVTHNETSINQLILWKNINILTGLPSDLNTIDTAPDWRNPNANLEDRAKAYLDINCSHCHTDGGSAALSGLRMEYWRKEIDYIHGVCNPSQGWRVGGYDIWPGRGDLSHIPMRMKHTAAKDRMPPIGRSLVDSEAVSLIQTWIDLMPYYACSEEEAFTL